MSDSNPAPTAPKEQVIIDASDLRKYRTELPNLYDDADLDVFEYRLLGHYKRVGICRESLETTAKRCKISEGQVSEKRQALANKGWVKLERVEMGGKRFRYRVTVIDRWIENFARYSGMSIEDIQAQIQRGTSPSPHEGSPSSHEGKKELIKNFNERFSAVAQKLEQLQGTLNSTSADIITTWLEKHTNEWICKAIDMAQNNGARHQNYVDKILIGWEANGYPKSRDEKVQGAKHGNSSTGNSKRTQQSRRTETQHPEYSDADRRAAERIAQRRKQPVPAV